MHSWRPKNAMNLLANYVNKQQGADAAEDKKIPWICWQTHRNCTCYCRTLNAWSCKMLGLTPAIKSLPNSSPILGSRVISSRTLFLLSPAHCLHFSELVYFLLITVWQTIAPNCFLQRHFEKQAFKFQKKIMITAQLHSKSKQECRFLTEGLTTLLSRTWMNLQGIAPLQIFSLPEEDSCPMAWITRGKKTSQRRCVCVCVKTAALGQIKDSSKLMSSDEWWTQMGSEDKHNSIVQVLEKELKCKKIQNVTFSSHVESADKCRDIQKSGRKKNRW